MLGEEAAVLVAPSPGVQFSAAFFYPDEAARRLKIVVMF